MASRVVHGPALTARPNRFAWGARFAWSKEGAPTLLALLVLFTCSGASGLVYEVVWLRYLTLVFGVTIYAVSTVLTAFMGGLALGGYVAGRVADRLRRPLRVYGLVEVAIGLVALLTPPAFALLHTIYRALYPSLPHNLTALSLVRFALACAILLPPAALMGATLPIVVRSSLGRSASLGTNLSLLYACNTAGGIAGAYLAGFVLIGSAGVHATTLLAATMNVVVGCGAIALDWWVGGGADPAPWPLLRRGEELPKAHLSWAAERRAVNDPASGEQSTLKGAPGGLPTARALQRPALSTSRRLEPPALRRTAQTLPQGAKQEEIGTLTPPHATRWLLAAFFVSGLASLAYQVIWTRILAIFFEATTYAFNVILCTFLLGLALGSYLVAPLINRRANWLLVAAVMEWGVAVTALLSITVISHLYQVVEALRRVPLLDHLVSGEQRATALMAFATMFPTTLILGAAFPIIMKLYTASVGNGAVGRRLGRAYAANVCGAIAGSWAAGFVLIPLLGTQRSLALLAALNALVAAGLLRYAWPRGFRVAAPAGLLLAAGAALLTPDMYAAVFARFGDPVLWYEEGLEQTVTILQGPSLRRMFLNGWHQADDSDGTVRFHALIGHLPMLLQPETQPASGRPDRDVLVIGLGGGVTAGAASAYDGAHLDVVELSGSVIRGARFFSHVNRNVVAAPNVRYRTDDGRNYLLLTDKKYDAIMADVVQPQHAGSAALYSVEYYRLARGALTENGVMVQWLDRRLPENQYQLLLRTFLEAFPYATAWVDGAFVIGSNKPYAVDRQLVARRLVGQARDAAAQIGLADADAVLGLYTAGDAALRAYAGAGPVVSDDHPYIEYFRSLPHDDHPADLSVLSSQ
jgi:spermidine synthase